MKTVLITGASSGFGEAIALELHKQGGYKFILTARRKEKLDALAARLQGASVLTLAFDIRSRAACEKAVATIPPEFADIDVLVNNAGLSRTMDTIDKGDPDKWNEMIDTNIKGLLYITRLISPTMIQKNSGHIINIGSIASHEIYVGGNVYCATKHAVLALSQAMRLEFLAHNIKVTQVSPGAAETNFSMVRFSGDKQKADKVYEGYEPLVAQDIAEIVAFVLSRPAHVCLNEIIVTPTAQFHGQIHREKK